MRLQKPCIGKLESGIEMAERISSARVPLDGYGFGNYFHICTWPLNLQQIPCIQPHKMLLLSKWHCGWQFRSCGKSIRRVAMLLLWHLTGEVVACCISRFFGSFKMESWIQFREQNLKAQPCSPLWLWRFQDVCHKELGYRAGLILVDAFVWRRRMLWSLN